ncbi:hypothetical protein J2S13_001198 [Oikeobacillus pervagus]|uniref:Uncharacterized protein n=1 Tax=Oikeobacillus pervagus TaxID=1325931 RepID=A0AAJ1WK65_9BACI|nr:hypothetical protein [Oikeobacillus pervagus]MDQ0214801.1 hypothetical protein [Oikeobacillus pervagus]
MVIYVVFLIQLLVWSCYSIAEWLSKGDHTLYQWVMFIIFIYIGGIIANKFIQSIKLVGIVTISSLLFYFCLRYLFVHV